MPLSIINPDLAARLEHSIREAAAPRPEPALPDIAALRQALAEALVARDEAEIPAKAAQAAVARAESLLEHADDELRSVREFNAEVAAKQRQAVAEWAAAGGEGSPPPYGQTLTAVEREEQLREIAERRGAVAGALQDLRLKAAAAEKAPQLVAARAAVALAAGAVLAAHAEHLAFGAGGLRDRERQCARDRIRMMTIVRFLSQGAGELLATPQLRKFSDDKAANSYCSGDDLAQRAKIQERFEALLVDPDAELEG